jgi:long-chain acyl-CoA synthetase
MANHPHRVAFFAGEVLEKSAKNHRNRTALIAREGELTFAELWQQVKNLTGHLHARGIEPADRVGLLLPNSVAFALGYFAAQSMGATAVVLDARLRGRELSGVLQDADLKLLLTHQRLLADVGDVLKEFPNMPVWLAGGAGEDSLESKLTARAQAPAKFRSKPQDDAVILYTSGTTGEPKGVVLDHINLAQFPIAAAELWKTGPDTVWGCILPMSHISGPIVLNAAVDQGSHVVIIDQFNPVTLLEAIHNHRITIVHGVPALFQVILGLPNLKQYDTTSLTCVGMMGTTVPGPLLKAFRAAQPHALVVQGYGLTETSPLITGVPFEDADQKLGSVGKAVRDAEIRVVDDRGQVVPVGEAGEIITRGPHVMKGYFRKPGATRERIRDGWLYTGDIGRADSDGYYYHLGRKDDLIITGGLNVYPAEVENLLYEQPEVQEAVVFPIPDEKRGSVIGAAVVLRPGATVTERELLAGLRANLATYKVPHKLKIRESLARTSSGKVMRDAATLLAD